MSDETLSAPKREESTEKEKDEKQSGDAPIADQLAYARRVFDNIVVWYNNADTKAQIILSLNGAFLAFLTSSIFTKKDELNTVLNEFTPATWGFLISMCIALLGSMICALRCLLSRLYGPKKIQRLLAEAKEINNRDAIAQVIWFFQMIGHQTPGEIKGRLMRVDQDMEFRAMASQISKLSVNVLRKHFWVNCGFASTVLSFLLFLIAGIIYLMRVH